MTDRRPNWKFFCPKTPCGHFHGLLEALTCSSVLISTLSWPVTQHFYPIRDLVRDPDRDATWSGPDYVDAGRVTTPSC